MKIKREKLPQGEDKSPTTLPQSQIQPETCTKMRRFCTTHKQTYCGGGHKSRFQQRSQTLSLVDLPNKQGKEADDNSPSPSAAARTDNRMEGTGEEEETERGGTPPPDSLWRLLVGICCECGPMLSCRTQ